MRNIFNGNYKKLDDDVSFQILRTNPRLTTNTKLMYDGEKIYFESFSADDLLSSKDYKNKRVWASGLFNRDIKNFLLGTGKSAYTIGQRLENNVVGDDYSLQYENMYWCGCEEIESYAYPQEFGMVAPLYLRKKLPNYFIIFKVDGPSNFLMKKDVDDIDSDGDRDEFIDDNYNFKEDILNKATIVKSFDLREGTVIGNYIRNYISQKSFEFDKSMYVNFSTKEIYYYGIDIEQGLLTTKVENFEDELVKCDNTVTHSDDWLTSGYERNKLIYPYIINFEFLFDDNKTEDYKFCRYFGYYCDDIDIYEFERGDGCTINKDYNYYLKDKYNNIHLAQKFIMNYDDVNESYKFIETSYPYKNKYSECVYNNKKYDFISSDGYLNSNDNVQFDNIEYNGDVCVSMFNKPSDVKYNDNKLNHEINKNYICVTDEYEDSDDFEGYDDDFISSYCDYVDGYGYSSYMFVIDKQLQHGDGIEIHNLDDDEDGKGISFFATEFEYIGNVVRKAEEDRIEGNRFSCTGSINDTAKNLCKCINNYRNKKNLYNAVCYNNIIVIRFLKTGSIYDNKLFVEFHGDIEKNIIIKNPNGDNRFYGGTDVENCRFKVRVDDISFFMGETHNRYLKTTEGHDNAEILSYTYAIDEFGDIDSEYYVICTDRNGVYVKISNTKQVEIVDKFYAKFGVLSFYPVKDFDFDTIYSPYCDDSSFDRELDNISKIVSENINDDDCNALEYIKRGRLFNYNGKSLKSEYDYFYENMIPELCTVSKTSCYISKWGYVDGMDSCENPYRLNCSKIFGVDNLSANLESYIANKQHFTHEMPYYFFDDDFGEMYNQYQYINISDYKNKTYSEILDFWTNNFLREDEDLFDKYFKNREDNVNKRHSTKYSRFNHGNVYKEPETLFRGVKFNISEMIKDKKGYKEVKSAKYNDYRFAMVYIPCKSTKLFFNNDVHFIKNDKFKFIVGIIICNIFNLTYRMTKSFMYLSCNNTLVYNSDVIKNTEKILKDESDGNVRRIRFTTTFNESFDCKTYNSVYLLDDLYITSPLLRCIIDTFIKIYNECEIYRIEFIQKNNKITYEKNNIKLDGYKLKIDDVSKGDEFTKYSDIDVNIEIKYYEKGEEEKGEDGIRDEDRYKTIIKYITDDLSYIYNNLSARNIKENINNDRKVHYNTNDFKIKVIEPTQIDCYDLFSGEYDNYNVDIVINDDCRIITLNRYSGYYQPIFKDILFYDDLKIKGNLFKFSNVKFHYDYKDYEGSFGVINNMFYHKINEEKGNTILQDTEPYYPLTGNYALDYDNYNIYSSNWDMGYYTKHKDIINSEKCNYIASVDNNLCMFGSKVMNVPENIELEGFKGIGVWNDNYIMNPDSCDYEVLYKEENNSVDYCLFLKKRLIRYFKEINEIRDEIEKYIAPEYSYGLKNTLDDDVEEYIIRNIIDQYRLDSIEVYVKQIKRGVKDENIENDYAKYIEEYIIGDSDDSDDSDVFNVYNVDDLVKYDSFERTKKFVVSNINFDELDKKITYKLNKGLQEYFAFKVKLIKK